MALNLHRIDKDVQRCDRNYWYFTTPNLERLRDIMCRYHWRQAVGDLGTQSGPWVIPTVSQGRAMVIISGLGKERITCGEQNVLGAMFPKRMT